MSAWLGDPQRLRSEHDLRDLIERITRYRALIPPMLAEHEQVESCR